MNITTANTKEKAIYRLFKSYGPTSKFALIFFICAILASCKPYSNDTKLSQIIEEGVLKVGSIYGRTTFYNGAEAQEGFEFELAQGFAEFLDVKLESNCIFPLSRFDLAVSREIFPEGFLCDRGWA